MSCTLECHKPKAGTRHAHCGACHYSFTGVTAFDLHRKGGECLDPATLGFSEKNRIWGAWGSAVDAKWW